MKKISLILSLLALISLVCLVTLRLFLGGWENYLFVPLGFLILTGGGALWTGKKIFLEFLQVKTTKEGMSMGAMIALTLILVIAINFLAVQKPKTFDFSTARMNTLSDQTLKVLAQLKDPLDVLYFYEQGTEGVEENKKSFIELLKKYSDASSLVKLQFVEVNENPQLAQQYGITKGSGVVFVAYQGRKSQIQKIDEQELTGALVKVTREKDKKVYFTTGHGERDLEEAKEPQGLLAFKKLLQGNRYSVEPIAMLNGQEIPADADVLVIAGPQREFLDPEIKSIERYLARGGALLALMEPKLESGLGPLFYRMGLRVGQDYVAQVLDTPIGKAVSPQSTPANGFDPDHPVTQVFRKNDFVLMKLPAPLHKEKNIEGLSYAEIVKTDKDSMAFPDTQFKGAATPGPHAVGVSITGKFPAAPGTNGELAKKPMQVLIFSDVDFVGNQLITKALNRDLLINSLSYIGHEENMISISPKEIEVTQMTITPNQFYAFIFGFILPLPLVLLGLGTFLWYRRRYA